MAQTIVIIIILFGGYLIFLRNKAKNEKDLQINAIINRTNEHILSLAIKRNQGHVANETGNTQWKKDILHFVNKSLGEIPGNHLRLTGDDIFKLIDHHVEQYQKNVNINSHEAKKIKLENNNFLKKESTEINTTKSKQIFFSEISTLDSIIKKRLLSATKNLIRCDTQIVSRNKLSNADLVKDGYILDCNKYEREAAYFYKKNGYDVILKLDHWMVGEESYDDLSKNLMTTLRKYLPNAEYNKLIFRSEEAKNSINLSEIYPEHYPLHCYLPDFIAFNTKDGDWKFIEVKSPTDKLSFRQANWYINLMPDHWKYELFCSVNNDIDDIYIKNDLSRKGDSFDGIYKQHTNKIDERNQHLPTSKPIDSTELERLRKEYAKWKEKKILSK